MRGLLNSDSSKLNVWSIRDAFVSLDLVLAVSFLVVREGR